MFATLLTAAAAAPAAPVPADTNPAPAGPAPWVVHLKADDAGVVKVNVLSRMTVKQTHFISEVINGQVVTRQVTRDVESLQSTQVVVNDAPGAVTSADGSPLDPAELVRRARDGVTVLVSADGKAVDRAWLRAVGPDTIVVAAKALAGTYGPPQPVFAGRAVVTTAAPRLLLLAAGPDGTVRVATRPQTLRYATSRVMFLNNGNGLVPVTLEGTAGSPTGPVVRPLSDVGFDAYDLSGRLVPTAEAVRRLRAGGLVLAAGDGRVPDPALLRPFRGDVLVLVSVENLTTPADPADPAAPGGVPPAVIPPIAPPLPAFPAVPAARPAVLRVAPVRAAPIRVAPAAPALPARPAPAPAP